MMIKKMALAAVLATGATGANAAIVYGVDELNNLVAFNSATPGTFQSSIAITGIGQNESIQALDFRSSNNVLYALSSDRNLFFINLATGVATQVGGTLALTGSSFGFDFNPTVDRIRIVSNDNTNYVVNPNTGTIQASATTTPAAVNVAYASDDVNAGRDPGVTANAYLTNSATQFAIDTDLDVLVSQANNAGTLRTIGSLQLPNRNTVGTRTSFDIRGSDAFIQNARNFYSVDLGTGRATLIGQTDESLFGIAIAPVPEPATWGLMILGVGAVGGSLRRRRATVRFANA